MNTQAARCFSSPLGIGKLCRIHVQNVQALQSKSVFILTVQRHRFIVDSLSRPVNIGSLWWKDSVVTPNHFITSLYKILRFFLIFSKLSLLLDILVLIAIWTGLANRSAQSWTSSDPGCPNSYTSTSHLNAEPSSPLYIHHRAPLSM